MSYEHAENYAQGILDNMTTEEMLKDLIEHDILDNEELNKLVEEELFHYYIAEYYNMD